MIKVFVAISMTVLVCCLSSCGGKSDAEVALDLKEREIELKEREQRLEQPAEAHEAPIETDVVPNETYQAPAKTNKPRQKTEAELRNELKQKECANPSAYLTGNMNSQARFKNAISLKVDGVKLTFILTSKAAIATYKDVKVSLGLFANTGGLIKEEIVTIHDYVKPGASITYKTEVSITNQQWKDVSDRKWRILGATCN